MGESPTLETAYDPRGNSINALRLILAAAVLVSHSIQFSTGGPDPLGALTGGTVDLGTLAVDGFFVLSGFLIVGSYATSPSPWRYLWRRALRILPGYWACLLVTAVVLVPLAQLVEHGTFAGIAVTGEQSTTSYVVNNAGLLVRQFQITGLFDGMAVNGSIHTLFYEGLCYLGVAVLGVTGLLLRRRRAILAILLACWGLALVELVAAAPLTGGQPGREVLFRFGTMFVAGGAARLFAHRLRLNTLGVLPATTLLAVALAVAALAPDDERGTAAYLLLAPPAVAYLLLRAGISPRLRRVGSKRDLSYGLYVYAWPVQALLLLAGAGTWPLPAYTLVALGVAAMMALASWTWVESPALALKSWTPALPFGQVSARAMRRPRGRG